MEPHPVDGLLNGHKETTHLSYLDSVRGLAAFSVLCSHYIKAYALPCRSEACERVLRTPWLHFFWDGGSAVCLFFILSGFVLSRKYFATSSRPSLTWSSLRR